MEAPPLNGQGEFSLFSGVAPAAGTVGKKPVLTFQRATEGDIPLLCHLAGVIWRTSYAALLPPGQIDYMLAWMYGAETIQRELTGGFCWEIALHEGQPAGFFSLGAPEKGAAKLHKLYLLPELQGRGLGQLMIARAVDLARTAGAQKLVLQVNKANERAQRAYLRAGFEPVESAVFDIGGGYVMDDFIMARPLAHGCSGISTNPTGQL